jgi:hypothetical protein
MENTNDKLIRIDTKFYAIIKTFNIALNEETDELKFNELNSIYILIKAKKFGRTNFWSHNQIQQFITYIKNGYIDELMEYIKYKNVA